MEGADKSTELWRHPLALFFLLKVANLISDKNEGHYLYCCAYLPTLGVASISMNVMNDLESL